MDGQVAVQDREDPEAKKRRVHREYMRLKRGEERSDIADMERQVCL